MSDDITRKHSRNEREGTDDQVISEDFETDEFENDCDDDTNALEEGLDAINELGADDFLEKEFDESQQADHDADLEDDLDTELDAEPNDDELEADAFADLLEDAGDAPDDDTLAGIVEDAKLRPKGKRGLSVEARRAIEELAEQRRIDRDVNYLDFDLDD